MKIVLFILMLQLAAAQWNPTAEVVLGDTVSHLEISDLFIGPDGTIYSTGRHIAPSFALYISAVSSEGVKLFEYFRKTGLDQKGIIIRPYDAGHFIIAGHSEDTTGTFNVRLLKMTMTGTVVWDTTFGNDGQMIQDVPNDVAIDQGGNIIIGGISTFDEVRSLLLKFSPAGVLLWSHRFAPLPVGSTYLHDIEIGPHGEIYGLSNNTFIPDTSRGTIFRWDADGNVVWSKSFNMSFFEERGTNLVLSGDTLFVAGIPWTDGIPSTALTMAAFRTDGTPLSYRTIPLYSAQQGVRDLRVLPNGTLALLNESFIPPQNRLHTMIISPALSIVYHDSLSSSMPLNGRFTNITATGFTALRYGSDMTRVQYSLNGGTVTTSPPEKFNTGGRIITRIAATNQSVVAVSPIVGLHSERMLTAIFHAQAVSVSRGEKMFPASFEILTAFPNPFNPAVTIRFRAEAKTDVELMVVDLLGRTVARLISRPVEAGEHSVQWKASGLSAGMYLAHLRLQDRMMTTKLLLVK